MNKENIVSKFNLYGKIAVVTGGCGFLGEQHCLALAENGAKVFALDLATSTKPESFNKLEIFVISCDITDENEVIKVFKDITEEHKKVDILINNAAIDHKVKSNGLSSSSRFETYDLEMAKQEYAVGIYGAVICSRVVSKYMMEQKSGVIINVSSDLGVIAPDHRIYNTSSELTVFKPFTYSIIKHALIGLSKYLAIYLAPYGIRVNTISPGSIENDQNDDFKTKLKERIPLSRLASVDEYKSAVQFLASEASSYMTGQNLIIDGGRSTW